MRSVTIKNNVELTIREVKKSDAEIILKYVNIIAGESDNVSFGPGEFTMTLEDEEIFLEKVSKSENNTFIVGFVGEELVAIADVRAGSRPRIRHSGELGISVQKKYWRLGIGRALMHYLIDWAKDAGLRKLNLRVREDNHGAIILYKSLGFFDQGKISREFFIKNQFYSSLNMGLELD